jgi:hypothetical protein
MSICDCLCADPTDEPVAPEPFDWSFNDADLPVDTWKGASLAARSVLLPPRAAAADGLHAACSDAQS